MVGYRWFKLLIADPYIDKIEEAPNKGASFVLLGCSGFISLRN